MANAVHDVQQRQAAEPANVARALPDQSYSLMDEEDIAEMSMIVAQIESAEEFNLTIEAVECSKLSEETEASYPQEEIEPKLSDKSAKHIGLLCEDKDDDIGEVLGLSNESVVEKSNSSLADVLLSEWGTPVADYEHVFSERRKSNAHREGNPLSTSTPNGREPFKDLKNSTSSVRKGVISGRKRLSNSTNEGDYIPTPKRYSNAFKG
ncbi:unnamed protein product [Angiostrongylus costaricensis]|uniref:DUF4005 domain-containing protein n=1 Tax=Angiostrongylus costaricensis TaxID=334426 RepID=A0A0R3PJW2_ANGCS|nr:unnamed protein product [Angiostrongylus costaricensis]